MVNIYLRLAVYCNLYLGHGIVRHYRWEQYAAIHRPDVATYQKTRVSINTVLKTKICCSYIPRRVSGGPETSDDSGLNCGKLLLLYYFNIITRLIQRVSTVSL